MNEKTSRNVIQFLARAELARERVASLTPREFQVLDLLIEGHQSKQIASELGITRRTVAHYRAKVMKKMQAKTSGELFRMVLTGGINPLRSDARAVQKNRRECIESTPMFHGNRGI